MINIKKYLNLALPYFVILVLFLASQHAYAENTEINCDKNIVSIIKSLEDIETSIPYAPPEEEEYLNKEFQAWLESVKNGHNKISSDRYNTLTKRPYYYAWQLHNEFKKAKESLRRVLDLPTGANLKTRLRAIPLIPMNLSNARVIWEEYYTNRTSLLTGKQATDSSAKHIKILGEFGMHLQCLSGIK